MATNSTPPPANAPAPAGYQVKPGDTGRRPGEQKPGRYPFTGPAYAYWGEQPGYMYDPYTDKYKKDPSWMQPKPPGLAESLLPLGATAAAIFGAKEGAEALGAALPGWLGGTPAAAATIPVDWSGALGLGASLPGSAGSSLGAQLAAQAGTVPGLVPELVGPPAPAGLGGLLATSEAPAAAAAESALPVTGITPYLGAAGAGLGAYGLYNAVRGQDAMGAGLSGAGLGLGLGAAAPLVGLGPVGWGTLGLLALGGGLGGLGLEQAFSMGDKDRWKTERNRMQALRDQGINIPDAVLAALMQQTGGRSKEELIALAQQTGGNVQFAQSRNEADLRPIDIINYATFAEHDPKWFDRPMDQRMAYAQQLLTAGLVREHHGTIDVNWEGAPRPPWETGETPPTQPGDAPNPSQPASPQPPAAQAPAPPKQPDPRGLPLSPRVAPPSTGLPQLPQAPQQQAPATPVPRLPGLLGTRPAEQPPSAQTPPQPQAPEPPKVGGPLDFGIAVPPGVEVPRISATKEYWEAWARNGYQAQAGESTGSLGNKYNPYGGLLGNQPPPIQPAEDPRNKYNPLGGLLGNQPPAQPPPFEDPRNKYNQAAPLMRPPGA